jgi:pimeloyl-ACP methyl ester carboxylesterase
MVSQTLAGVDLGVDVASIAMELMAAGRMGEMIIVMPNAANAYGGSWYERSDLIGDYRTYIAEELVSYIDGKYRTIADPNHRAIAGHSMGGYGALSLAIEYADVFGAVAAMGPGSADLRARPHWADLFLAEYTVALGLPQMGSSLDDRWNMFLGSFTANVFYSLAAAWTPNLDKPPFYVDLPVAYPEKAPVAEVWEAWEQRDLVHQIDRDGTNLARTPVMVLEGRGPTLFFPEVPGIDGLLRALYTKTIPYTYATVPGDHISHLRAELSAALEFLYPHIAPSAGVN